MSYAKCEAITVLIEEYGPPEIWSDVLPLAADGGTCVAHGNEPLGGLNSYEVASRKSAARSVPVEGIQV